MELLVILLEHIFHLYLLNVDEIHHHQHHLSLPLIIHNQEKNLSELQLDYSYLSSPSIIEKKIENLEHNKYSPVENSKIVYQALKNINPNVFITIYPGVNHNSWDITYGNKDIYDWLLKNQKAK